MPLQNSPKCFPRRAKLLRRRAGQREPKDRSHTAVPDETTSIISFNQINFTKYNKSWNRAIISLSLIWTQQRRITLVKKMFRMLITVILVAKLVMAQSSYEKRDASQIQSRIIATAAGHLQNMDLEDPAFLSILEVIASKINETEQCAYMNNEQCQLFISKTPLTTPRLESRAVGNSLQMLLRGFVSKIVSKHFPKVGSMVTEILNNTDAKTSFSEKFQTSSDILVLKTLAKVNQGIEGIRTYKIPMATLCSIMLAFLLVLMIAKSTSACEKFKETRAKRKAAKLDRYFAMRMRPIQEA